MEESDLISFVFWSVITGIIVGVTGFSYKAYLRKKEGQTQSYMHRDQTHSTTFDSEREYDVNGTPVLKK